MSDVMTAPGVMGAALTTFVTCDDVKILLGCSKTKAYESIRDVNRTAKSKGIHAYGQGKANKYLFAEHFAIPVDVVNSVIERNSRR